ncbi:hypothetical protein BZA70DRAFT_65714 [Myxozyma melibiosi]|uniref:Uncharacterized protein n=1 Tax=Myxozyma melibiosi TaxID=54550 RepID=A0ABR1F0V5_9ASCO
MSSSNAADGGGSNGEEANDSSTQPSYMDPEMSNLLSQLDSMSLPKTDPIPREPSPDALGSLDALSARFENLFNRPPVSSARPRPTQTFDLAAEANAIDPRVFLGHHSADANGGGGDDEKLVEETKWKDLTEVEDEEFERALRELSAKQWELSPEDLDELKVLESTVVVSPEEQEEARKEGKYLDKGYLKAVAEDLDQVSGSDSATKDAAGEERVKSDRELSSDASKLVKDSKSLLESYNNGEDETLSTTDTPTDLSSAEKKEFTKEEKDIEEQADRLVQMYASLSVANAPSRTERKTYDFVSDSDDEQPEKNEDEQADELVDMYARLASDEEPSGDEAEKSTKQYKTPDNDDDDDDGDLFARLKALKSPPTSSLRSDEDLTTKLPDAPTLSHVLPSAPVDTSARTKKLREDIELGCCMCSGDAEYRCLGCEKDDEDNYLYCGKCFLLSHLSEDAGYEERTHRYKKLMP